MAIDDEAAAARGWRGSAVLAAFLLANLAFLLRFADRNGYEGDDLNSIVPMFHLADARAGLLLIYRYAWQPLSYEAGAALYRLTGSPEALFLLAPIAGAVALALLLRQGWDAAEGRHRLLAAIAVLLAVPEFWYSGLYYNSSILGLPFLAGAILLVRGRGSAAAMLAAGLLAGIAILMRMDFVLACPLLAALAWARQRRLLPVVVLALAVLAALLIGWIGGWLEPPALIDTYRASNAEILQKSADPGWDLRAKILTWTVLLSPVGWAILALGGPPALLRSLRADGPGTWLCLIAVLPMLVPMKDLLSVKYALPLLAFAPLILARCLAAIASLLPPRLSAPGLAIAGGAGFAILSISLFGHAPYVEPRLMPSRMVGTHDGARSYGGYLWMMMALDGPAAQDPAQREADRLAARFLAGPGPDMAILGGENVFDPGGLGWRHVQLRLEKAGVHGALAGPHRLLFTHRGRRLWLIGPGATPPAGANVETLDLRG